MITRLSFDELVFRIKDSVRRLLLKYCNNNKLTNKEVAELIWGSEHELD